MRFTSYGITLFALILVGCLFVSYDLFDGTNEARSIVESYLKDAQAGRIDSSKIGTVDRIIDGYVVLDYSIVDVHGPVTNTDPGNLLTKWVEVTANVGFQSTAGIRLVRQVVFKVGRIGNTNSIRDIESRS